MSNYKQTMKLYTEASLKKVISIYSEEYKTSTDEILKELNLTPIELPSDEEVKEQAHIQYPVNLQPNGRTSAGGKYDVDINYSERNGFIQCAKWLRDKIQGGNNEQQ